MTVNVCWYCVDRRGACVTVVFYGCISKHYVVRSLMHVVVDEMRCGAVSS